MDLETVNFLLSEQGSELLDFARSLEGSFLQKLTRLRKRYPPACASATLETLELRARARKKFERAQDMFFTREALEQSSSEIVSRYRAKRFEAGSTVLDLGCGIGGDSIGLAGRCLVTAVDSDPVRVAMARHNAAVYDVSDRIRFFCEDVTGIPLVADAAFADPSRRLNGRRSTSLSEISPPLEFLHRLMEAIPDSAIKLSPATDDSELESLHGEIEFISLSGECKEALVWLGRFRTAKIRATVLPAGKSIVDNELTCSEVTAPGRYLYEPDPCVIRGHLVELLAARLGMRKIDRQIAYLTSDSLVHTPFARAHEILDSIGFNLKSVKRRLQELGVGRVVVKKRGVAYDPAEMEARLRTSGPGEAVVVLTRISEKPWALICRAIGGGEESQAEEYSTLEGG
jgi:hypothetical protein